MTTDATLPASAPPPASAVSQLSADFPWPGFAPYEEADRPFFHSRRLETDEVLRLLSRDVLTLLVGPTGVGKTSLVQAGLVPVLLEGDCLPVVVRMDWFSLPPPPKPDSDDPTVEVGLNRTENPLTRQLITALESAAVQRGVAGPKMNEGESLWEYFHRSKHRWWSNRQKVVTPVVIIDRFEEAFTVGRSNATAKRHADRFFEELSELASNRPPAKLAKRIETGEESGDAFVFESVPVRVLLVMREEFAARLTDLRFTFPTLRRSQFRLAPFSTSQARDGIQRAAAQRNLFEEGAVDSVVEFLASEGPGEQTILPAHLSVVCSALSIERAHRGGKPITRDFLAVRPGRLMHDFITAAVSDLPPAARALLEEHLTDIRGTAQRIPLAEALTRTALPREALDTLVQRHLVRIDSHSAVPYVSLAHDLLAGVLAITRLERVAHAKEQSAVLQQAQVHAQMQAQAASVESKVRQQRMLTWVAAASAVILAAAAATTIALSRNKRVADAPSRSTPTPQLSTPAPFTSPTVAPTAATPHVATPSAPLAPPPQKATGAEAGATAPAKSPPAADPSTSLEAGVSEPKGSLENPTPSTKPADEVSPRTSSPPAYELDLHPPLSIDSPAHSGSGAAGPREGRRGVDAPGPRREPEPPPRRDRGGNGSTLDEAPKKPSASGGGAFQPPSSRPRVFVPPPAPPASTPRPVYVNPGR